MNAGEDTPDKELQLQSYLDGRLTPDERERFAAELAADPMLARRADQHLRIQAALRQHFDDELDEPIPPSLLVAAHGLNRQRARDWQWRHAAAIVLAAALGLAGGWMLYGQRQSAAVATPWVHAAAIAHAAYSPEVRHPVEVGADDQAHLVAWLSKRLGSPLTVPDLAGHQLRLVGGRLLPDSANGGVAAQFMYEGPGGQRMTLYVRRDASRADTAFRFSAERDLSVFYWVDRGFGYALSGQMPRQSMLAIADTVYRQLNP